VYRALLYTTLHLPLYDLHGEAAFPESGRALTDEPAELAGEMGKADIAALKGDRTHRHIGFHEELPRCLETLLLDIFRNRQAYLFFQYPGQVIGIHGDMGCYLVPREVSGQVRMNEALNPVHYRSFRAYLRKEDGYCIYGLREPREQIGSRTGSLMQRGLRIMVWIQTMGLDIVAAQDAIYHLHAVLVQTQKEQGIAKIS